MPLYEYQCSEHGVFELARSMNESSKDAFCPSCGSDAARIVSVPSLARVAPGEAKARERNERSQHEPRVVTIDRAARAAANHEQSSALARLPSR